MHFTKIFTFIFTLFLPFITYFYIWRVQHVHQRTVLLPPPIIFLLLHHNTPTLLSSPSLFNFSSSSSSSSLFSHTYISKMAQADGIITPKRKDGTTALSPTSIKKRRVLEERSQNINNTPAPKRGQKLMSSQNIKSSFEEDLDRLTQEIGQVDSTLYSFILFANDSSF